MSFEQYRNIYLSPKNGIVIRPKGEAAHFSFSMNPEKEKRYKLFVTGETTLFYQWKDEPDYQAHYHTLTDALDTVHANRAQYCLDFSCDTYNDYIKRIYKQLPWTPVLSYLAMNPVDESWQAGLWVKAQQLEIAKDGYLHMHIEIRHKSGQVYARSTELPPDEEYIIPIPSGTYDWTKQSISLDIPKDKTASVCVWIEGLRYSGNVYLESPFLVSEADLNLLADFSVPVHEKEKFHWVAQNLSKKEWPKFSIALNGETIFEGERFERCHRHSEWEIDLPASLLKSENQISISLISDYHDPLPYEISEISILTQPNEIVSVLSVSEVAPVGGKAYALVRTTEENITVSARYLSASVSGEESFFLKEPGLHGISFDCVSPDLHADFELTACGVTIPCHIPRIIYRENDGVLTGTGDMVYILQDEEDMEEYLCWYISNNIGNMITVRPSYRWSGTRVLNTNVWKQFVRVANELGLRYVLMRDGRELPGFDCNPMQELDGEGYLGAQIHERDGQFFYWSPRKMSPVNEAIYAMKRRIVKENPSHSNMPTKPSEYLLSDGIYTNRNPFPVYDAKITAEETVRDLASHRENIPRHTGPSWSQKYFVDAGFTWLGAETMYSSMEPQMAFMRGTCKYSGQSDIGVHHATQWSSTPHDVVEHYRRLRLALYVSYMQGATESNIEEGLWHLEEYYSHFHRFSDCCLNHTKQQQDFYRYVQSHARTGTFYTPLAVLQGHFDGCHGFVPGQPWGWVGVKNTEAEDSWHLLRTIYPNANPGTCIYLHGCDTDHPVGYYSGTPYGNIDVLPAECETKQFDSYGALAFLGYNCAEDMDNLVDYVKNGGTLLLTYAHLTHTTLYKDIAENRRCYQKQALSFSEDVPVFVNSTYHGHTVSVCSNLISPEEVLETTDDGKPFVCKYTLGSGTVILFCADAYPANPAIRPLYESALSGTMQALCQNEAVWASTGDDVAFTVYQQEDGSRHIYFLAVDWYKDPDNLRQAELRIGENRYPVSMPFGTMIKCVSASGIGVWPHTEDGEVLSVSAHEITVQGVGTVPFSIAANGIVQERTIDFTKQPIQTITI